MLRLLPVENWRYSMSDILNGLINILFNQIDSGTINIENIGQCIPVRSARAGIYTILKSLNLSKGSRVGVPLYCCPVVFKAIEAAGCKHCFIDIDYTTCCISADDLSRKRNDLDAIIAVHMFGNTCDMHALQDIAEGKPIIEDCAQSLGSMFKGKMTGTYGAAAAFSFRSGKYLSVGEGGALFSNEPVIMQKLEKTNAGFSRTKLPQEIKHLAETYIRTKLRTRPLYGLIGYPLWKFYNKKVDYSAKSPIAFTQSYISDTVTAAKRLNNLDLFIKTQRHYADIFTHELGLPSNMYCPEIPEAFYNRYLYPIFLDSVGQRDKMIQYLHNLQIGTAKPYHDIAKIAAGHYGYKGNCPVSEQVANRVLVMPNHHNLEEHEIYHIAHCIKDGLKKTNN